MHILNLLNNVSVIRFFKYVISFILGGSIISSFPPIYYVIAAPVAVFILSLIFLSNTSFKESMLTGFFAGAGFGAIGFYWFYYPILYVTNSIFLSVLAVLTAALVISTFFIGISIISYFIPQRNIWMVVLYNTAVWSTFEIIRGKYLFGGIPWNVIASLWDRDIYMLQTASLVGMYGLGFITYGVISCVLVLVSRRINYRHKLFSIALVAIVIGSLHLFGYKRVQTYKKIPSTNSNVVVMQPNVDQLDKNEGTNENKILYSLVSLTERITAARENLLVVWPETVISTRLVDKNDWFVERVKKSLFNNATLITGVIRGDENNNIYNSALVINPTVDFIDFYDKIHLVPFGEYIPIVRWLNIDNTLVSSFSFAEGQHALDFKISDLPLFKILICFEGIFPDKNLNSVNTSFIVNISNDGWYGNSVQPSQHLSLVRFRSIEGGLPMIRAVNSGISVLIDSVGNIQQYLPMFTRGYFIAKIPSTYPTPSLFAKLGNILVITINSVVLLVLLVDIIRKLYSNEGKTLKNAKRSR